jgi:hypothetical protein
MNKEQIEVAAQIYAVDHSTSVDSVFQLQSAFLAGAALKTTGHEGPQIEQAAKDYAAPYKAFTSHCIDAREVITKAFFAGHAAALPSCQQFGRTDHWNTESEQSHLAIEDDYIKQSIDMLQGYGYSVNKPCTSNAMKLISEERNRQTTSEGYNHTHDDSHDKSELAKAADCYYTDPDARILKARYSKKKGRQLVDDLIKRPKRWPWSGTSWKPSPDNRVRELVKAGALYQAEKERLERRISIIANLINSIENK